LKSTLYFICGRAPSRAASTATTASTIPESAACCVPSPSAANRIGPARPAPSALENADAALEGLARLRELAPPKASRSTRSGRASTSCASTRRRTVGVWAEGRAIDEGFHAGAPRGLAGSAAAPPAFRCRSALSARPDDAGDEKPADREGSLAGTSAALRVVAPEKEQARTRAMARPVQAGQGGFVLTCGTNCRLESPRHDRSTPARWRRRGSPARTPPQSRLAATLPRDPDSCPLIHDIVRFISRPAPSPAHACRGLYLLRRRVRRPTKSLSKWSRRSRPVRSTERPSSRAEGQGRVVGALGLETIVTRGIAQWDERAQHYRVAAADLLIVAARTRPMAGTLAATRARSVWVRRTDPLQRGTRAPCCTHWGPSAGWAFRCRCKCDPCSAAMQAAA